MKIIDMHTHIFPEKVAANLPVPLVPGVEGAAGDELGVGLRFGEDIAVDMLHLMLGGGGGEHHGVVNVRPGASPHTWGTGGTGI